MGLAAAFRPETAQAIAAGMTAYLSALPEALYALFCTGYLGYTAPRQWGKVAGTDKQDRRYSYFQVSFLRYRRLPVRTVRRDGQDKE